MHINTLVITSKFSDIKIRCLYRCKQMQNISWQTGLQSIKITITVCAAFLIGLGIDSLTRHNVDHELLSIGSFDHPDTIRRIEENDSTPLKPFLLDPFIVKPYRNATEYKLLPHLIGLAWPEPVFAKPPQLSQSVIDATQKSPKPFEPVLRKSQVAVLRKLLDVFSDLMFSHGYGDRFWITGGTLVGSYHFHDFIPWDDDIDILADAELRPEIQRLLKTLQPEYEFYSMWERDKLFTKPLNNSFSHLDLEYSIFITDNPWPWPFMDIGYYQLGPTHTCESTIRLGRGHCIANSAIFPLIYRPFGKNWYPSPSNAPLYLRTMYRMRSSCVTFGYSHMLELESQSARVSCLTLADRYAFMRHASMPRRQIVSGNETLAAMFIIDKESLVEQSNDEWNEIHHLLIPIRRNERVLCEGYGVPEPR